MELEVIKCIPFCLLQSLGSRELEGKGHPYTCCYWWCHSLIQNDTIWCVIFLRHDINFLPRSLLMTTEWQMHSKLWRRKGQRRNPGKCYQLSDPDIPGPHMTKEESAYIQQRKCDLCFSLQTWGGGLVSRSRKWLVTWSRKNNAEDINNPRKILGWSRNCTDNHMSHVTIESLIVAIHFKFLKNGQASAQATDHFTFLDSSCTSYFSATCTM